MKNSGWRDLIQRPDSCTSSSASLAPTLKRFPMSSRLTIRARTPSPGPAFGRSRKKHPHRGFPAARYSNTFARIPGSKKGTCASPRMSLFYCLPLHFCQGNFINPAFGDCEISVLHGHHVPNNTTAGWDQPGLELLGFGIEPDQRVRLHSSFAVTVYVALGGYACR